MALDTLEPIEIEDLDLDLEVAVATDEPQLKGGASITLTCAVFCAPSRFC